MNEYAKKNGLDTVDQAGIKRWIEEMDAGK